jgi:hypothetical protein
VPSASPNLIESETFESDDGAEEAFASELPADRQNTATAVTHTAKTTKTAALKAIL